MGCSMYFGVVNTVFCIKRIYPKRDFLKESDLGDGRLASSSCFPLRQFYCFLAIARASSFLDIFDGPMIPIAFARP